MVKGIIFDFDGVIVDSEVVYLSSLVEYLEGIGHSATLDDVKYVVGQNMNDIAACLIKQFNLNIDREKLIKDSISVYNNMIESKGFEPMKGLKQFLEKCKEKGIKLAVASSSDYPYLYRVMDQIGITEYFSFVLSGEDFVHSKPDPEIYNVAAEKMGMDKKDLLIIEDSVNGIKAGVASGIKTIGFKGSVIKQDTSQSDEEVYDFSEINI